ncbi:MAG: hypothetical protein JNL12_23145 [Planctomycetes bacterium]|nr:hypothetical protein [Planctomycetota bacterium]
MVSFSSPSLVLRRGAAALFLLAVACQTAPPVTVSAQFTPAPAFATRTIAEIAVLPVEDGTPTGAAARHLTMMRQEVMRQLVDRLYTPLTSAAVDAGLGGVGKASPGESLLAPANLQKMVGHAREDAVFALRVERWDEARLAVDNRVVFQFQAAMVAKDGAPLWSGTIQGEVKAGGAGPAPFDKDGKARSCASLAITEMLQKLPMRTLTP